MSTLSDLPKRTTLFPPHFLRKKIVVNALSLSTQFYNLKLFIYEAAIDPPIPHSEWGTKVQEYADGKIRNVLNHFTYIEKGRLMSWTQIHEGKMEIKMVYHNDPYLLTLSIKKTIDFDSCHQTRGAQSCLTYLNNRLKSMLERLKYTQYHTYCYKPEVQSINKHVKLQLLKGYRTYFEFINHRLHLLVNPTITVIKQNSLLEQFNFVYLSNSSLTKQQKRNLIIDQFKRKQVMAHYGSKQIYRIDQIIFDLPLGSINFTFKGTKCTIIQYYRIRYGLEVTSKVQPLIKARVHRSKLVYLLPEFLKLTQNIKNIPKELKERIQNDCVLSPKQSYEMLDKFVKELGSIQQNHPLMHLVPFGMSLEPELTQMDSVVLEYPMIKVGKNQYVDQFKPNSFGLSSKQLYKTDIPLNITVICPFNFDIAQLKDYSTAVCGNLGLMHSLAIFTLHYECQNKALKQEKAMKQIKTIIQLQKLSKMSVKTNICWIIIPDSFSNLYNKIKETSLNANIQLPSQVTRSSTLEKKSLMEIYTSIFIQMAAKVGNRPWTIQNEDYPRNGILIIGISLAKFKEDKRLIAYCCNTEPDGSLVYSNYIIIEQTQSLSMKIRQIVQNGLDQYIKHNKYMPREIVVLRRGRWTEGKHLQMQAEVRQIREIIRPIIAAEKYMGLRYYLLNFQSDLRFYWPKKQMMNPLQGTLINTDRYCLADFYMITHQNGSQLSRPLHFQPLFNSSDFPETDMQRYLYETSFQYFNKTGKVDVPAMLRNAQKMAKSLTKCNLKRKSIEQLKYTMFYL